MKKYLLTLVAVLLISSIGMAQRKKTEGSRSFETGKNITELNLKKDITARVKLMKKEKNYGLIKGAIHFKTVDVGAAILGKGQGSSTVTSYAMLQGVSDDLFEEIAEEFFQSFESKLAGLGLSEIGWDKITSAKKWTKLLEKAQAKEELNKNVGSYKVFTKDNRPHFKVPLGNLTVFNQMKSISKDIGGPVLSFDVMVDFARFDIEASRWRSSGYGPGYDFVTTETSANILPQIGIEHYVTLSSAPPPVMYQSGLSYMDAAGRYDQVHLNKSIYVKENYALDIDSFKGERPKIMKKLITINNENTGTFVVKADPTKYKRIALDALNAYADYMITAIKAEIE